MNPNEINVEDLADIASPCMKCGSVQCTICIKDLQKFIADKLTELEKKMFTAYSDKGKGARMHNVIKFSDVLETFK